jgi:probable HAF family extracellular repeat protein
MKTISLGVVAASFALSFIAPSHADTVLLGNPRFEGLGSFYATGVSGDGSVVVGYGNPVNTTEAVRLTGATLKGNGSAGTLTGLGYLSNSSGTASFSQAFGTNYDGSVVVGMSYYSYNGAQNYAYQAFRWSGGTMVGLPFLSGLSGVESVANAVSGNGAVVVGWSQSSNGAITPGDRYEAFRWYGGTTTGLGYLPGDYRTVAVGTNTDGSVVVGTSSGNGAQAFRWSGGTMTGLGYLPGETASQGTAVSADGSVVIGHGQSGTSFRWTAATGMVNLGLLNGLSVDATAIDADGSVIGGEEAGGHAALWTQSTGWLLVMSLLTARGNDKDLLGWDLTTVTGISADGTIIVGDGVDPSGHPAAWMASISLKDPPLDTPLPATLPLFASGLVGLGLLGWRRKHQRG